jgi:glycosyltransferase involved in cell wall biosynthesis
MRITFTITNLGKGGAEKQLSALAIRLRDAGHQPSVIALMSGGWYADYLTQQNIPVTVLNLDNRHIPREMLPGPFLRLTYAIRRQKPDVMISYLYRTTIWASLAAWIARVPVIIASRRDAGTDRERAALSRWLERLSHTATTHYVVNSEAGKQHMTDIEGIVPQKIKVIYNGIDLQLSVVRESSLRQQLHIRPEQVAVGMLANFWVNKNHKMLIHAAHVALQKCPSIVFMLAGADKGYQNEIVSEIDYLGLQNHFYILGQLPDPSEFLAAIDIGVLCSQLEGCSNTILEYMAYAKPVVATRVGGNPELVIDGETGILAELDDYEGLGEALVALANDPARREAMGQAGQKRVEAEFSWDRCVRRHQALLGQLLEH